ncbi:hypothetical protein PybrP1_009118 [[Pythium] brassicae (nom. inval.)]|nr:hypothetical protein PybrP1_009118 [[Pythium] brassicae (nom. inval.)]
MAQYVAVGTPRSGAPPPPLDDAPGGAHLHLQQERHGVGGAHSMARVYVPSLREKTRAALEGRWGLYLEATNFALSVLIFSVYIAELYTDGFSSSVAHRCIELCVTLFFIFDLALHLFAAPNPWSYLLSPHGIIDLLTIIPSVIVFLVPATRSQLFFVLRVLRIFRALRVLRLKQFIRFKKSKFDYELAVFILSSVAVVLCAAGMFHALEESHYISHGDSLDFHEALYFVLVTTATIGYGDISPRTTMGQMFVIVLIIGIFTIVPHEVSKLNRLAKQSHDWDKDYVSKSNASGHVIVSGSELTTDAVLDFLREFYHASRGNIHLDVVFLSDLPPSRELARVLTTEKYRWRTCYLRGNLTNSADQQRVQLGNTTAVFLLANKQLSRDPVEQDAATVLHTLSVRNFADSNGASMGIYTQLLSQQEQHEMTSQFLGANATRTSKLRTLILARAAVCPGASTLILNLLQSVDLSDYSKRESWSKLWIQELFPMVFTDKFQFEKFEDVARNVFERYGAILLTVYDKKIQRVARSGSEDGSVNGASRMPLAPFQSYICEGDIGFVMAKSASVVLHIVNTYGFWQQEEGEECGERQHGATTNAPPVRVSSDTLLRRPSPHNSFRLPSARVRGDSAEDRHVCSRSGSRAAGARERKWRELNDEDAESPSWDGEREANSSAGGGHVPLVGAPVIKLSLRATDQDGANNDVSSVPVHHGSWAVEAARLRDAEQVLAALRRDHFHADTTHLSDHYVVCSGVLSDALALVRSLRRFSQHEHTARAHKRTAAATTGGSESLLKTPPQQLSVLTSSRSFVLLVESLPDAAHIMDAFEEVECREELLESVYFVRGSSSKSKDLVRAGAPRARHVVILPVERAPSASPVPAGRDGDNQKSDSDNILADYGVVSAMLALEIARLQQQQQDSQQRVGALKRSPVSPRRLRVRHSLSISEIGATAGVEATAPSFQREVEHGLPVESVKLRMLERFPDLDAAVFREKDEVIEARLHREVDTNHSRPADLPTAATHSAVEAASVQAESSIGVMLHTNNARFCRPRDRDVCHDAYPYLTPSFASGNVFLSSVLDRIVCQSFYNPYITDVVESLAAGSSKSTTTSAPVRFAPGGTAAARRQPLGHNRPDDRHCRLFRIKVDANFVGGKFLDIFLELLRLDVLAIGILRSPDPVLENLLPYVYTCPDPETVLHANDRLFVVG